MRRNPDQGRITAVLGPTNTGKTHLAVERMLGHASGILGCPLRLLARELYDRCVKVKGESQVALVTGEEKIVPAGARYFLCTAESMPLDRPVAFVALDEVQMCADPERGHIFTERLLTARGGEETMFLGADTMRGMIRRLVPQAEIVTRPRLSRLTHAGSRKLTRLPRRTAIVAFSANDVYAIAELVRRQRGGAAVVLGALSPRTRNAQVALYQSGEVDYLVATDAIGMGLNMDVDHVAFASLEKFDGRRMRALLPAEIGQIAGRAGRSMNDGTFGTTGEAEPMEPDLVERVEGHVFQPVATVNWRNGNLLFTTPDTLLRSLKVPPTLPGLQRARPADDQLALEALIRDPDLRALANHPERVKLLWDVCRIPDFRKAMADGHARLLGQIYRHLVAGRLPEDWVASQVKRLDRTDGDLHTLIDRIADTRIWTYITHQPGWIGDAAGWQGRARAMEDRLSDALHERLTQRFVDRRTAVLVKGLRGRGGLDTVVEEDGQVRVEGHAIGQLNGFHFIADKGESRLADRAVANAATRALEQEMRRRERRLNDDQDDVFGIADDGTIHWRAAPVGRMTQGPTLLEPEVQLLDAGGLLDPVLVERIRRRLKGYLASRIATDLSPLLKLRDSGLTGAARGLAFQISEAVGCLPRAGGEAQVDALSHADRQSLTRLGVRLGREVIYMPAVLRPKAQWLGTVLRAAHRGDSGAAPMVAPGRVWTALEAAGPAVGFLPLGQVALRADMVERLAGELRGLTREGPAVLPHERVSAYGLPVDRVVGVLDALGYRAQPAEGGLSLTASRRRRPRNRRPGERRGGSPDSPFAKLRELISA